MLLILNLLILSILLAKGEGITGMSLLATADLRKPPEARQGLPGVLPPPGLQGGTRVKPGGGWGHL